MKKNNKIKSFGGYEEWKSSFSNSIDNSEEEN